MDLKNIYIIETFIHTSEVFFEISCAKNLPLVEYFELKYFELML